MRLMFSSALLGLAWFGIATALTSAIAWTLSRAMLRSGRTFDPGWLLAVRLLPASLSLLFVLAVFLPSHWVFEPAESDERFGVLLAACAIAGFAILSRSLWRAARAVLTGHRFARLIGRSPRRLHADTYEVGELPGVSLAGIVRPRILIGSEALAALTASELEVAISHEVAHRRSQDNLKRFVMFCAPDLFGWTAAARELERQWQAASECQADDRAVMGDRARAVVLASALVKVAQIATRRGGSQMASLPVVSAFHGAALLETRVRRLVAGSVTQPASRQVQLLGRAVAVTTVLAPAGAWALDLTSALHALTESMVRFLP
jgi:Zn-dependent protease with chaperone function